MLKRNKDQIKGTIKIPSRLRSTCLSLFFPTGNFPCGNTAAVVVFRNMEQFWALLEIAQFGWKKFHPQVGWKQAYPKYLQPRHTFMQLHMLDRMIGVTAAARIFSWSHWSFPIPAPNSDSAQGLPAVVLGSILGTWGSSMGTEGWHRPSGARLALSLASDLPAPSSSLPPRRWGGERRGDRSMDLDSGTLIRQAPVVCAGRAGGGIHSFFPSTGGFLGTKGVSHLLSPSFQELLPLSTMP